MYEKNGIILRKLEASDLILVKSLKDESWFGTHRVTIQNKYDIQNWFDSLSADVHAPVNLMLIGVQENKYGLKSVGLFKITNIDWISRKADVAWDVFKDCRGKGLGKLLVVAGVSFCRNIFNLRRLDAEILKTNIASQKCAMCAGFKEEGCKKKAIYRNGEYLDSLIYGLTFQADGS